jgi:phosphatidylethanolamine-binding protein (PEBP) family uncharacterized protein
VGFFDGAPKLKADFHWPGAAENFPTSSGVNGYGLFDMSGNVWQFVNDWYDREYYAYSPAENPPGPEGGTVMPDGQAYRVLRGGNWFNGESGHGRVSNRNPSYYRGPEDPNHPYYHVGFRVVRPVAAESRPVIKPTRRPGGMLDGLAKGEPAPRSPVQRRVAGPVGETAAGFILRSPAVAAGEMLPKDYTGDGNRATLPLEWSGAPAGTAGFALILHHVDPQGLIKWYWTLYNIPANIRSLPKNVKGVGMMGNNSVNNRPEYAPPRSQGPGPKTYVFTLYALSSAPQGEYPDQPSPGGR